MFLAANFSCCAGGTLLERTWRKSAGALPFGRFFVMKFSGGGAVVKILRGGNFLWAGRLGGGRGAEKFFGFWGIKKNEAWRIFFASWRRLAEFLIFELKNG